VSIAWGRLQLGFSICRGIVGLFKSSGN